ncbi:MAG: hypothetical protein N4A45_06135 [Flavobacteriales bacterium]|jgi:hypothetical protein|nr:hypothetical protein [Flavobacteriales bacterium]
MLRNFIIVSLAFFISASAQVGIGTVTPHESSILEVKATDRGFLPPRMTALERSTIANPEEGLIVYCTNCCGDGSLTFFSDVKWVNTPECPSLDWDNDGVVDSVDIDDDNDGLTDFWEKVNNNFIVQQFPFFPNDYISTAPYACYINNIPFDRVVVNYFSFVQAINVDFQSGSTGTVHNVLVGGRNYLETQNRPITGLGNGFTGDYLTTDGNPINNNTTTPNYIVNPNIENVNQLPRLRIVLQVDSVAKVYATLKSTDSEFVRLQPVNGSFSTFLSSMITANAGNFTNPPDLVRASVAKNVFTTTTQRKMNMQVFYKEDIDGDGIPNWKDADSDGDGCPDVRENGYSLTNPTQGDFILNKSVGVNGMIDEMESANDSGERLTPVPHPLENTTLGFAWAISSVKICN